MSTTDKILIILLVAGTLAHAYRQIKTYLSK